MNEETGIIDNTYKICSLGELLNMPIEKTSFLMRPTIQEKGLSLIYANRGSGKTYYSLGMALALASGIDFAGNKCNTPQKVLYVDGEMDPYEIQQRLEWLKNGFEMDGEKVHLDNLHLFLVGLQGDIQMPILSNTAGQSKLEHIMDEYDIKVVFIDNIYTLYHPVDENDAASWVEYNAFNVRQRQKGRSIVWVHHTGKTVTRGPRGSATIETLLNASVYLRKSDDVKASDELIIEVEYTKSRSVAGEEVATKKYRLEISTFSLEAFGMKPYAKWIEVKTEKEQQVDEAKKLRAEGFTIEEIAKKTGIKKSTVGRAIKGIKKAKKNKKEDTNTQEQSLATE